MELSPQCRLKGTEIARGNNAYEDNAKKAFAFIAVFSDNCRDLFFLVLESFGVGIEP